MGATSGHVFLLHITIGLLLTGDGGRTGEGADGL